MKDILLKIISSDSSYNKSATRYLHKTHPILWVDIISKTDFLLDTAKPKQRVWHILNDIWEIPKCPIQGIELKWADNRYQVASNRKSVVQLQHLRGDFVNGHSKENNEKRKQGNIAAVKNGRKYRSKETYTVEQKEKAKHTYLKNYGIDNPSKHISIKQKISDSRILNGATPTHLRSSKRLYYEAVGKFTGESWQNNFDQINPTRLNRSEYDLDHIYSKHQGFNDNIPPYIIGHWTNLRMLSKCENSSKGSRCDKTSEQLFEDFFKNKS
jgi:hypothetical protein